MTRFLIECTYVFHHPEINSGIQRVVRNVINNLPSVKDEEACIPVILREGTIFEVKQLAPEYAENSKGRLQSKLEAIARRLVQVRNRYWLIHSRLLRFWPWKSSHNVRRVTYVLCRLVSLSFMLPLYLTERILGKIVPQPRIRELTCRAGDVLVLLDSSWQGDSFPVAEKLKQQGVTIISVIYDLIPLTHPQFCDDLLVHMFERWFEWTVNIADGFIAISSTIRDEVRGEVQRRLGKERADALWYEFFHLGSELDQIGVNQSVRPHVKKLFNSGRSVYLMVSTIEPRKNHAYLLDAFEQLWQNGSDVVLCFIGRIGWKNDILITRVKNHPEFERRLFMFNDLSDVELEHCYGNAKALVFPSYVEGFGLPLVEAMQRGLPVMASDIPVFHEIGGEFVSYFDLNQPKSLSGQIQQFEDSGNFPATRHKADWSWLSWENSTCQLIDRIGRQIRIQQQAKSKSHEIDYCAE